MPEMKISRVKFFEFRRPDGECVEIPVPPNWNQGFVQLARPKDYAVHIVIGSKPPAEAAFGTVAIGDGPTAGYIIPGAAILSPENPYASDPAYCSYNMLIAETVCRAARANGYELAAPDHQSAKSRDQVFRQGTYYLITWNKYFSSPSSLSKDFALALCNQGLVFSTSSEHPSQLYSDFEGSGASLRLKSTSTLPSYVVTILGSLVPYCTNPFLRFFYLYQVIEYMMGLEFDSRVSDVRARLVALTNPSMVELREVLERFQDATREKTRINAALLPPCPSTALSAETLLAALNALEPDTSFAERIYRVRNILFHDYKQLHERGEQIASLCRDLFAYLVAKRLLA